MVYTIFATFCSLSLWQDKKFCFFFFKGEGLVAEKEGKVGGRGREREESWRKRGERKRGIRAERQSPCTVSRGNRRRFQGDLAMAGAGLAARLPSALTRPAPFCFQLV